MIGLLYSISEDNCMDRIDEVLKQFIQSKENYLKDHECNNNNFLNLLKNYTLLNIVIAVAYLRKLYLKFLLFCMNIASQLL